MATTKWVTVGTKYCELVGRDVEMMEERVYPADVIAATIGYRVNVRRCTAAIDCNLSGYPCSGAFSPTVERFNLL